MCNLLNSIYFDRLKDKDEEINNEQVVVQWIQAKNKTAAQFYAMDYFSIILWICSFTLAGSSKGKLKWKISLFLLHKFVSLAHLSMKFCSFIVSIFVSMSFSLFYVDLTVSFFGDSHVAMPLQEAKISTNLRLRFRTRQSNGILFLAAGRTDYCLLSIDEGRVKLNFKINEHFTEVNKCRQSRCSCHTRFEH